MHTYGKNVREKYVQGGNVGRKCQEEIPRPGSSGAGQKPQLHIYIGCWTCSSTPEPCSNLTLLKVIFETSWDSLLNSRWLLICALKWNRHEFSQFLICILSSFCFLTVISADELSTGEREGGRQYLVWWALTSDYANWYNKHCELVHKQRQLSC